MGGLAIDCQKPHLRGNWWPRGPKVIEVYGWSAYQDCYVGGALPIVRLERVVQYELNTAIE